VFRLCICAHACTRGTCSALRKNPELTSLVDLARSVGASSHTRSVARTCCSTLTRLLECCHGCFQRLGIPGLVQRAHEAEEAVPPTMLRQQVDGALILASLQSCVTRDQIPASKTTCATLNGVCAVCWPVVGLC
jgi:hypothetical protein